MPLAATGTVGIAYGRFRSDDHGVDCHPDDMLYDHDVVIGMLTLPLSSPVSQGDV